MKGKKASDIYQEALAYIFCVFEPLGYKQLKDGTIKKKRGVLNYEIHFSSSHYNYIDYVQQKGSILLEVTACISYKKDWLYSFSFTEPRASRRFQILNGNLELNYKLLQYIVEQIELHFIDLISKLEQDPSTAFEPWELFPILEAKDYSWVCHIDRRLLEQFGLINLLPRFDANTIDYMSLSKTVARNFDSFYYYMVTTKQIDPMFGEMQSKQDLLSLAQEAYSFLNNFGYGSEFVAEEYKQILASNGSDVVWLSVAVHLFCQTVANYFRTEPEAAHLIDKIDTLHKTISQNDLQ